MFDLLMTEDRKKAFSLLGDSWNYMPPILVQFSAKHIATEMLVIEKLNERKDFILGGYVCLWYHPSQQGTSCSKLATQAKEQDVKTVQD